jgi:predicted alpha/beta superfamily hydrolase
MTRISRFVLGAAASLLLVPVPANAQNGTGQNPWVREVINSKILHAKRPILIVTPAGYRTSTDSFPVLIILDAEDRPQFNAAIANIAFLESRNEIPGLIIVGIPNGSDRTHDLTPAATGATAKDFPTAGGAAAFERFLTDEALPFVRGKYRARHMTILAGHSFGGLFGLYVAATGQNPYMGIIAMSPSIWWNDSTVVNTYARAIAALHTRQRIFATSGEFEPPIDRPTRKFTAELDSLHPTGVAYGYLGLRDDTHGLTPQPSLIAGLRFVFEPVSIARLPLSLIVVHPDSASAANAVEASESQYARGARSIGLPPQIPEPVLNTLGYGHLLQWHEAKIAAVMFAENAAQYPNSGDADNSYGDGLMAEGDTTAAFAHYRGAVQLYEQHDSLLKAELPMLDSLAQHWWQALASGKIDRSRLTAAMNKALTPAALSALSAKLGAIGKPVRWFYAGKVESTGDTTYEYRVILNNGTARFEVMVLTSDGKLAGWDQGSAG